MEGADVEREGAGEAEVEAVVVVHVEAARVEAAHAAPGVVEVAETNRWNLLIHKK